MSRVSPRVPWALAAEHTPRFVLIKVRCAGSRDRKPAQGRSLCTARVPAPTVSPGPSGGGSTPAEGIPAQVEIETGVRACNLIVTSVKCEFKKLVDVS